MAKFKRVKIGDLIKVPFGSRVVEAIVIDPSGVAQEQPSVGIDLKTVEKYSGIPLSTHSDWMIQDEGMLYLKVSSGRTFRTYDISGSDGNIYSVIEVCDWMRLAVELVKDSKGIHKTTFNRVIDFMAWFTIDGFYAQSYYMLGLVYGQKAHHALQQWKEYRGLGIPHRKQYASYLSERGEIKNIGKLTNIIYRGLFGYDAKRMIEAWETQAGKKSIARNHIPEAIGLEAVAYCEKLVVVLDLDDLGECHQTAIELTRKKFRFERFSYPPAA